MVRRNRIERSAPLYTEEMRRNRNLKANADTFAAQARTAHQEGDIRESKELFIQALSANNDRSDMYRFRQAADLFVEYRKHHKIDADMAIDDLVVDRYELDTIEYTGFARRLLLIGLLEDEPALVTVAEDMLDDYIVISTILQAARADTSNIKGDLQRALLILDEMEVNKFNQRKIDRTKQRILQAITGK